MPRPARPCPWRALALAALVLLGPQQEHSSLVGAARIRAVATDAVDREVQDPVQSKGWERHVKRLAVVRDALRDMLANIKKEEKEEVSNFFAFTQWCTDETDNFQKTLDDATLARDQQSVRQKELEAVISQLENDIIDITKQEQKTADSLAQEQNMDKEDDKKYNQDMTLNTQSTSSVDSAIKIVGKVHQQGGFMQNGILTRLQMNEPGESSYVLGIMKQLRNTLSDTRTKMMASQKTQEANSQSLVQTAQQQLDALRKEKAGKNQQLTQARVDIEQVKRDLDKALTAIPEAERRIKETKAHCDTKTKAWAVRKKDRIDEQAAIMEALGYLTNSVMEKMAPPGPNVTGANLTGAGVVAAAPSGAPPTTLPMQPFGAGQSAPSGPSPSAAFPFFVQVDASKSGASAGAGALAYLSALADQRSNNDVKKVVKDLAGVLMKQQKDEETLVSTCRTSLDNKEDDAVQNQDEISKLNASINFKDSEIITLSAEVVDFKKALQDLDVNLNKSTILRKEEKRMYESQSKDRKLSIKVIKQAMQVLNKFYETKDLTAFRQMRAGQAPSSALQLGEELVVVDASLAAGPAPASAPPPSTWSGSSRSSIAGSVVTKLMEKIRDDMQAEQTTADVEEKAAVTAYEQLLKDSRDQFDKTMSEITERMKRKATLTVKLGSDKEDKAEEVQELGNINDQLKALHSKCDDIMKNIKDRTKAREFELSQLRDVLDILAGSTLAVRTGV